jgi:hypothetical protein
LHRDILLRWQLLHLAPILVIPLFSHALHRVFLIDAVAVGIMLFCVGLIAWGQSRLLTLSAHGPGRWAWQTAFALAIAIACGLVTMSTIDLAGYDQLATLTAMPVVGAVLGGIQSRLLRAHRLQWVVTSTAAWLVGAVLFRAIIAPAAAWEIGGRAPFGLVYNAGHNELLWTAAGIACYGLATGFNASARSAVRVERR